MRGVIRPRPTVVSKSALVPPGCLVEPPPNRYTHEVRKRQGYYYGTRRSARPDGTFAKGTRVVLMVHDGGPMCRVVDGRGLYVLTAFAGLQQLQA